MTDLNKNIKIENHGVIPKEEEQATPEELYARLIEKITWRPEKKVWRTIHYSSASYSFNIS